MQSKYVLEGEKGFNFVKKRLQSARGKSLVETRTVILAGIDAYKDLMHKVHKRQRTVILAGIDAYNGLMHKIHKWQDAVEKGLQLLTLMLLVEMSYFLAGG